MSFVQRTSAYMYMCMCPSVSLEIDHHLNVSASSSTAALTRLRAGPWWRGPLPGGWGHNRQSKKRWRPHPLQRPALMLGRWKQLLCFCAHVRPLHHTKVHVQRHTEMR